MLTSIFFSKSSDVIKHNGISELLIIHFKWFGIIAQSTAFVYTHSCILYVHMTHSSHLHITHTCCSFLVLLLELLDVHFAQLSGERAQAAEGSL